MQYKKYKVWSIKYKGKQGKDEIYSFGLWAYDVLPKWQFMLLCFCSVLLLFCFGPIVYRLGRQVFILVRGVRLPLGLHEYQKNYPFRVVLLIFVFKGSRRVFSKANCLAFEKPGLSMSYGASVQNSEGGGLPYGLHILSRVMCDFFIGFIY